MALLKIDWNPGPAKVRRFGLLLAGLALPLSAFWAWRGHPRAAGIIAGAGVSLGLLTAAFPGSIGLTFYKAWMGVSFVIGTVMSPVILGIVYYGVLTPLSLIMRLGGRDALRLKRPEGETYWVSLNIPEDKSYFERLF